jgi:hypothetical protein
MNPGLAVTFPQDICKFKQTSEGLREELRLKNQGELSTPSQN